jgi:hypothetical protein
MFIASENQSHILRQRPSWPILSHTETRAVVGKPRMRITAEPNPQNPAVDPFWPERLTTLLLCIVGVSTVWWTPL